MTNIRPGDDACALREQAEKYTFRAANGRVVTVVRLTCSWFALILCLVMLSFCYYRSDSS